MKTLAGMCVLVVALALASPTLSARALTPHQAAMAAWLARHADGTLHSDLASMPPIVRIICSDSKGRLAAPGAAWQVTDVVSAKELPARRLAWWQRSHNKFIVQFEQGGIAHTWHVYVVDVHGRRAELDFSAAGGRRAHSVSEVVALMRAGEYREG